MDFSKIDFKTLDWKHLLTSFEGRIGREMFWVGVVAAALVAVIVGLVAGFLAQIIPSVGWIVVLALQLVALYPAVAVAMKRLHDRDKPDVWLVVYFGPYALTLVLTALVILLGLNLGILWTLVRIAALAAFLFMAYDLGWLVGTAGPNRHGPAPAEPAASPAA